MLLAVTASLSACTGWRRADVASAPATAPAWDHVRVTRTDGARVELWAVRVASDTLYGLAHPRRGSDLPPTTAVPVDSIRSLEVRGVHRGRTTALAAGVGFVGVTAVVMVVGGILLVLSTLNDL